jgi:transcription-repair coupling factor (superfamily II helicase)
MHNIFSLPFIEQYNLGSESPLIIFTKDNDSSEELAGELRSVTSLPVTVLLDNEILPYDEEAPQSSIISKKINAIHKIKELNNGIIVSSVLNFLSYTDNPDSFYNNSISIDEKSNVSDILSFLNLHQYKQVNTVNSHGEFSIHPQVVDIFAYGEKKPLRIRLSDTEKLSLQYFSVANQRTTDKIKAYRLHSKHLFSFNQDNISCFREFWRSKFNSSTDVIYKDISKGSIFRGVDFYSRLFTKKSYTLFDYIKSNSTILTCFDIHEEVSKIEALFNYRYGEVYKDRKVLPVEDVIINNQELSEKISHYNNFELNEKNLNSHKISNNGVTRASKISQTFKTISPCLDQVAQVLITINSDTRIGQLKTIFQMKGIKVEVVDSWDDFISSDSGVYCLKSQFKSGFIAKEINIALITEAEIFGSHTLEFIESDNEELNEDLFDISKGDPITHVTYGVGRFIGLTKRNINGIDTEYVELSFAEDSKVLVPLEDLDLLTEYKGLNPESVPLDLISNPKWKKNYNKSIIDIKKTALELINIRAKKEKEKGFKFLMPKFDYVKFSNEFPFQLTQDQNLAIKDVISDMCEDKPMDRIIVGDVGYGKTEIAMRASFISAFNSKQVCIIAPTTLLAQQHFESFKKRFSSFNYKIALMTRATKSEEKELLEKLSNGDIDIVIGTHRLIQKDIKFNDLGLIVIDEEHRFGVKQKDLIKHMKSKAEYISLSATPIPRTLSMTLHGIRDISTIKTAPSKRLSVRTYAKDFNDKTIKEALEREMLRKGQAFFLHNDVESIEDIANHLRDMFPDNDIRTGHGRMKELELHSLMNDFREHKFDILVSTTIIETGIDIPNANTMIINNADKLGLAQLHQLRGRVGRSNKQAYTYLLTSKERVVSEISRKRLDAMTNTSNLGGGFKLSSVDLEIRGAGEVLGEQQSGHIHDIGYYLYFRLLEKAMDSLSKGNDFDDNNDFTSTLALPVPANYCIDSNIISHEGTRMNFYRRLASSEGESEIAQLEEELSDRFGSITEETRDLFKLFLCKYTFIEKGVKKLSNGRDESMITFKSIDSAGFIKLYMSLKDNFKEGWRIHNESSFIISNHALRGKGYLDVEKISQMIS